jgi:uncharacterized protein YcbK (DUF882 family)
MHLSRRTLLVRTAAGALATTAWARAHAAPAPLPDGTRLSLMNLHTGEKADVVWVDGGQRLGDAQAELDRLLRDHRSGDVHPIDAGLFDQLVVLKGLLGTSQPFHVISGYRSPATNARLADAGRGVARHSLHMEGRAIDIRVPGVQLHHVHRAALTMGAGGVGYYERSQFVHLDTGRVRRW